MQLGPRPQRAKHVERRYVETQRRMLRDAIRRGNAKYVVAHRMRCTTLAWVIITPLGNPVDPDVNRMCATSPSLLSDAGADVGQAARSCRLKAGAASASGAVASSRDRKSVV